MVLERGVGGGRLTPEDAHAIVILRHVYGISRGEASRLPGWELRLLVANGRSILGLDDAEGDSGSLTASDMRILTTPGIGG